MGQPYIGEIRMFGGNFAPQGWMFCNGQTLSIADYETLYVVVGTTYGGDGVQTFLLPDLRGRVPMHAGAGPFTLAMGERGGLENVTLTSSQLGGHTHALMASSVVGNVSTATATSQLATMGPPSANTMLYHVYNAGQTQPQVSLNGASISATGGSTSHNNIQPTMAISFIISLFGIFPSPS